MKKPSIASHNTPKQKTKGVTLELELETYWKVQDRQRILERETGVKQSIARICEQILKEALDGTETEPEA